jgi:hypothetical protein
LTLLPTKMTSPHTPSTLPHVTDPRSNQAAARLNINTSTLPGRSSKIVIKSQDGTEVDLLALKKESVEPQP